MITKYKARIYSVILLELMMRKISKTFSYVWANFKKTCLFNDWMRNGQVALMWASYFIEIENCYSRCNRIEPECSPRHDYNYASVRRLSRVINQHMSSIPSAVTYNPLDRRILKYDSLLPNCVSTFLMPFYFDIFRMSELGTFSQEHIQLMLALKRSFKAHLYLNYDALVAYLRENILWNCFVLFKYRQVRSSDACMGYFNFYLSFVHIVVHLEQVKICQLKLVFSIRRKIYSFKSL